MGLEAFRFEPLRKLRAALHGQKNPTEVTVFTVAGTGQLDPTTGDNNFPAQIAERLDPDNWVWKPVYYPAAIPFTGSVLAGKASLAHGIRQTPGKFAILGYSQGAMVATQIYQELVAGNLRSRNDDMVSTIVLGNPCRMAGTCWPGYSVGGHGIASADRRLTSIDSRWREFSAPDDLASAVGDDEVGKWLTTCFMALWGGGSLSNVLQAVQATLAAGAGTLGASGQELLSYFGIGTGSPAAHTQYGTYQPLGGGKTCIDLAVEYLNQLGLDLASATDQEDTTH